MGLDWPILMITQAREEANVVAKGAATAMLEEHKGFMGVSFANQI